MCRFLPCRLLNISAVVHSATLLCAAGEAVESIGGDVNRGIRDAHRTLPRVSGGDGRPTR